MMPGWYPGAICASGLTIDVLMKAGSLPLRTLSRSGPTVPFAFASASVWHAAQPEDVKSALASGAAWAGAAGLGPAESFCSHAAYARWLMTCAVPRIVECPSPHSSAHTIG